MPICSSGQLKQRSETLLPVLLPRAERQRAPGEALNVMEHVLGSGPPAPVGRNRNSSCRDTRNSRTNPREVPFTPQKAHNQSEPQQILPHDHLQLTEGDDVGFGGAGPVLLQRSNVTPGKETGTSAQGMTGTSQGLSGADTPPAWFPVPVTEKLKSSSETQCQPPPDPASLDVCVCSPSPAPWPQLRSLHTAQSRDSRAPVSSP